MRGSTTPAADHRRQREHRVGGSQGGVEALLEGVDVEFVGGDNTRSQYGALDCAHQLNEAPKCMSILGWEIGLNSHRSDSFEVQLPK